MKQEIRNWWQIPLDTLCQQLQSNAAALSAAEARARLKRYGPNRFIDRPERSLLVEFLSRFRNPLVLILIAASVISAFTGEVGSFVIIVLTSRLFDVWMLGASLAQRLGVLVAATLLYGLVLSQSTPESEAGAMAFVTVVLGNLGLILGNRSRHDTWITTLRRPNRALWWIVGGTLLALGLVFVISPVREIFRVEMLNVVQVGWCVASAVLGLAWCELWKLLRPHVRTPQGTAHKGARGHVS